MLKWMQIKMTKKPENIFLDQWLIVFNRITQGDSWHCSIPVAIVSFKRNNSWICFVSSPLAIAQIKHTKTKCQHNYKPQNAKKQDKNLFFDLNWKNQSSGNWFQCSNSRGFWRCLSALVVAQSIFYAVKLKLFWSYTY